MGLPWKATVQLETKNFMAFVSTDKCLQKLYALGNVKDLKEYILPL